MSTTQTKLLSSVPAVAAVAEGDKIPIVNASGQTVLVPLSGLLSAVKVGGRNLIKNSGVHKSGTGYPLGVYYYGDDRPQVGETLIVSVWGTPAPGLWFEAFNSDGDGTYGQMSLKKDPDGVHRCRLPIKKSHPVVAIYAMPRTEGTVSTIERIKVERGNIPTDWTPAPEDWGGVKLSPSAICAFIAQLSAQKGGLLHEPNQAAHKRGAERHHVGRARVPRRKSGSRLSKNSWCVPAKKHKFCRRIVLLRVSEGDGSGQFRVSGIHTSPVCHFSARRGMGGKANRRLRQKSVVSRRMDALGHIQGLSGNITRKEVAA